MQFQIYDPIHFEHAHVDSCWREEVFVQFLWQQFFEQGTAENTRTKSYQGETIRMQGTIGMFLKPPFLPAFEADYTFLLFFLPEGVW